METLRLHLPPNPPGVRVLLDAESRVLDRLHPSPYSPTNCLTCLGKKTFLWLDKDREPAEYDCDCVEQYLLYRYLAHCGVPLHYQRLGWADLQYPDEKATAAVIDYLDRQQRYVAAGFGLVLHGSRGNGKTLLGYLLMKNLVSRGVNCFSTTFSAMIESFAGGWRDAEQERWFNRTVRNAQVLYIDDVGREYRADRFGDATKTDDQKKEAALADNRPGSMKETLLEDVIRHRVASSLPTVITTNYSEDDILHGYGGHTLSLLGEKTIFVPVTGQDRRSEMRQREQQYVIDGLSRPVVIE